jgi:hypothetical protein
MPTEATVFCRNGCGTAVPQEVHTYRFYCSSACAARALARRLGHVTRVGLVNIASTTAGEATMAMSKTNTTKKPDTKKTAAAPTAYTKEKLAVQAKCKIGSTMTYHGIKTELDGKRVTVEAHEGRGGIVVKHGNASFVVSPFALLGRPDTPKAAAKGTATVKGKGKAPKPKATPAPAPAKPTAEPAANAKVA